MRRREKLGVVMQQGSLRRLLGEALSLGGYAVTFVGGGPEGAGLAGEEALNLVLYDLSVPAAEGREALRWIRARDAGARILAFSDPATAEMARQACDLGAWEYVGDPFDLRTLLRAIADNVRSAPPTESVQPANPHDQ